MIKKGNDITPEEEEEIIKMLSRLRVEPAPEADFESRFLADFKNRMARDSVTRPARTLLWEHVRQFLDNIGGVRRWAMVSTSLAAVAFVAVALMSGQPDGVPKAVASVNTPVVEQVVPVQPVKSKMATGARVRGYATVASAEYEPLCAEDDEPEKTPEVAADDSPATNAPAGE